MHHVVSDSILANTGSPLTKITNARANLQYLRAARTWLIQRVCSPFQLVPPSKGHVLCEVKLATRETKMSAISVTAWLLSAVAFAAINNGELHYKTLIAWINNRHGGTESSLPIPVPRGSEEQTFSTLLLNVRRLSNFSLPIIVQTRNFLSPRSLRSLQQFGKIWSLLIGLKKIGSEFLFLGMEA